MRCSWRWRTVRDRRATGGSYVIDDVAEAYATVAFSGPSITWNTISGPDEGKASIVIDSRRPRIFDLSARSTRFVHRTFDGLGPGTHVIRIGVLRRRGRYGSGTSVAVDGFNASGRAVASRDVTYRWGRHWASGAFGVRWGPVN